MLSILIGLNADPDLDPAFKKVKADLDPDQSGF